VLFDPASHEPLIDAAWNESRARAAIAAIVADTEGAFDEQALWTAHPLDHEVTSAEAITLYIGASGVIWALDELARGGASEPAHRWSTRAAALHRRYLEAASDDPAPSLFAGEAGILLLAHRLGPEAWQEDRLLACIRANVANPFWELMWGSPGTMLAAQVMYERTGDERWAEAWRESADRLWQEWRDELWLQSLYGKPGHILGPIHGFVGNVHVLGRGNLLDEQRRSELERRAAAVVAKYAQRTDGLAQWPPALEPGSSSEFRTQWCHGAPGIVASLAGIAAQDQQLTELLVAGGELTWRAGPLTKGPGLCHGTAGNGYAFLKLFERTGDELWLDRGRAFAMHAAEQAETMRSTYGRGRYTLWTGDVGTALYLQSCLSADADLPTLDRL
jgi:Lanthionine synthetase C-like protein